MRSSCKAFSQLEIKGERAPCGWGHPWAGSPGFYKKANEQARGSKPVRNIPPWPLHQLFLTCLSSSPDFLDDGQQCGSVSRINPFLPDLLLGPDVCAGIETLTKTRGKSKSFA
jgi:hypothetical protein